MAVLAFLLLAPARLNSEPATTPARPKAGSTTSTTFAIPPDSAMNPLRVYPRRPGAKYEDSEALPTAAVTIGTAQLRIVSTRLLPHDALPGTAKPSALSNYETLGLVDGYSPRVTRTAGDVLHVRVHVGPLVLPTPTSCVGTTATNGTVLVPYALPAPRLPTVGSTTTTGLPDFSALPLELDLYLPVGSYRGRLYLTCADSFSLSISITGLTGSRAVWGFDV